MGEVLLHCFGMALFSNVLPFSLLSWAQTQVSSSFAGIAMAIVPLVVLPLSHFFLINFPDAERLPLVLFWLGEISFINGDIAFLQKLGKPVMAWSPMGGGSLFETQDQQSKRLLETLSDIAGPLGCDISTIALSWLISHPAEIIPVIGTNNIQRITEASKAKDFILDRETWFEVYTASIGADVP